jgi:molecular chaperone HscA
MGKISINIVTGSLKAEEIIVGIDLGTTNSLVAYINKETKLPVAIADSAGETIVPSIIYFDGQGGIEVGNSAHQHLIDQPEKTIYSVKRLLGKSYKDLDGRQDHFAYQIIDDQTEGLVKIKADGRFWSPIELSAEILKELKNKAEHFLRTPIHKAVITVPAYFNDSQRQATRDAGKLAGLEVLRIVNEPTAASLAYGIGEDQEKTIAVFDLGGGTFDISILNIQNGIFEVLSTNGDTFLGGDDFDRTITEHWMNIYHIDAIQLQKDKGRLQQLRLLAEEAKKELSRANEVSKNFDGQVLQLDQATYIQLITPIINRTIECCRNAMADSGLVLSNITDVVMVGGSTRTPEVKRRVAEFFKGAIIRDHLNPDEVVAQGAAIQADILAGNRKDLLLIDVTPLSLGIETMGGLMDTIINRNSKVPVRAGRQYTTSVDGQVNMKIAMYQGERDLVKENRKLGEFELKGIPAMPAGFPKVEVNFILNADGILKVEATELRSGVKQEVEVKPQYGLTDAEVEAMLLDSFTHAKTDIETRLLIEAKTEAQQMIYVTEKFLTNNSQYLNEAEITSTRQAVELLKEKLAGDDRQQILDASHQLNEISAPFAERVMDIAIGKAMKGQKV